MDITVNLRLTERSHYATICVFFYESDSYAKLVALRQKNPQLKILLAIGGWNLGSQVFSNMSSSATDRQTFIARYDE